MALDPTLYLTGRRTNVHWVLESRNVNAPPQEFWVDSAEIPTSFRFTNSWADHNFLADQNLVLIGQGIIVGLKDNPYNVAPVQDTTEGIEPYPVTVTSGGIPSMGKYWPGFMEKRYQNVIIADSAHSGSGLYTADVWPIGVLVTHAFMNVPQRFSGNEVAVWCDNATIQLPYVGRSFAADMQLGCVTDANPSGSVLALQPGDYLYLGGSSDGNDAINIAGKFRKAAAADADPRWICGQVWTLIRNMTYKGWLDKVALTFGDVEHALTYFMDPTTLDYGPWAPGCEANPYKWPGGAIPTGGVGRGIYGMTDGNYYGVTRYAEHTVTEAEASTADVVVPITRYFDGGEYKGYIDTDTATMVVVNLTNASRVCTATSATAAGVVTLDVTAANAADVLSLTVVAYGQMPGVPVNSTPTNGDGSLVQVGGNGAYYGSALGIADIVLKF